MKKTKLYKSLKKYLSITLMVCMVGGYALSGNVSEIKANTEVNAASTTGVSEILTNKSTINKTEITLGEYVTLKGSASGGTAPYQYAYYCKPASSSTWKGLKGYSSTTSISYKPTSTGTYDICIKAKDANGTAVKKYYQINVNAPLKINSNVSATTIAYGKSVTLTGGASGGTAPYQYAYYYKLASSSTWKTLKGYSNTTSISYKPASTGTYDICIKAKDAKGTAVKKYYQINVNTPLEINANISTTTITYGKSVTLTGGAGGGTAPYKYAYYYKPTSSSEWKTLKGFSSTTSVSYKPTAVGTYDICIKVKDQNNTVMKKYFSLTVNIDTDVYADEVIDLVNAERVKNGLSELSKNNSLSEIANIRAEESAVKFSHTRPDGTKVSTLFEENGIVYQAIGENIAGGYKTPQDVMNGWINSEGHKANILSDNYNSIGVGCYNYNGTLYWVQVFAYTADFDQEAYIDEVIKIVNEERAKNGLSSLAKRDDMCEVAQIRAVELETLYSHTRPDGSECFTAVDEYGISSYYYLGENIAYGQITAKQVMEAWMNSEGHRANILNESFNGIGVGCYRSGSTVYWVQMFIGS